MLKVVRMNVKILVDIVKNIFKNFLNMGTMPEISSSKAHPGANSFRYWILKE